MKLLEAERRKNQQLRLQRIKEEKERRRVEFEKNKEERRKRNEERRKKFEEEKAARAQQQESEKPAEEGQGERYQIKKGNATVVFKKKGGDQPTASDESPTKENENHQSGTSESQNTSLKYQPKGQKGAKAVYVKKGAQATYQVKKKPEEQIKEEATT